MTINSEALNIREVKACPCCESSDYTATGDIAPGFDCVTKSLRVTQPDYLIRECSNCGLLYRTPALAPDALSRYYEQADYTKWEIADFFPTERAVHQQLQRLPLGARVLDFGCSSGRLLGALVPAYDCCGIEMNTEAAAAAASKGLRMLPATVMEHEPEEQFQAAVAVDVFEHLQAPVLVLKKLLRLVKPGGAMLIVTGNGDDSVCRLDPAQFWYFRNFEHLFMLTRKAAEFLARELDAKLELWQRLPHYDTPLSARLHQRARHFFFWQFRRGTLLARTVLPFIPILNRARSWPVAPTVTCGHDHVLALFRKPTHAQLRATRYNAEPPYRLPS